MRKATAAIVIWTATLALLAAFFVALPFAGGDDYQYERGLLALVFGGSLFIVWLIGVIPLSFIWFLSRPKDTVAVYGPQGQEMMVSETEAKFWVEKRGWAYEPSRPYGIQPYQSPSRWGPPPGSQPPF